MKEGACATIQPLDGDIAERDSESLFEEGQRYIVCIPGPEGSIIECIRINTAPFSKACGDVILREGGPSLGLTHGLPQAWRRTLMNMKGFMAEGLLQLGV